MSWGDEIEKGQTVFRNLLHEIQPAAEVEFGAPTDGRYLTTIKGPQKSARLWISEEDFADLAQNGGRRADIRMRIIETLAVRLRELKFGPGHAWPPMFGGAYRPGDIFPSSEDGVLRAVENAIAMPGLHVEIEYGGRVWSGILQWDGDTPPRDKVREVLNRYRGKELRELRDVVLV